MTISKLKSSLRVFLEDLILKVQNLPHRVIRIVFAGLREIEPRSDWLKEITLSRRGPRPQESCQNNQFYQAIVRG